MMMRRTICACAVLVALGAAASADPVPVTYSGGTLIPMDDHPTVSLVAEQLVIEPGPIATSVTVDLDFHNEGSACDVQMAFPVSYFIESGARQVDSFLADADGQPLEVTAQAHKKMKSGEEELNCTLSVFTVPFEQGQARHLTVRYDEMPNLNRPDDGLKVPYMLGTGACWKGPLRDFRLEVRLGDRANFHGLYLTGDKQELPTRATAASLFWQAQDYEGTPGVLRFYAGTGPASVTVNGEKYPAKSLFRDFRWRQGHLLVQSEVLCRLTGCEQTGEYFGNVTFSRGRHKVTVRGWQLACDRYADYALYVDPDAALAEFGGSIEVERDEAGDAHVSIAAAPYTVESAREAALDRDQPVEMRLACLARTWSQTLPVAEALAQRTKDDPSVLLWGLGYLARKESDLADPADFLARMEFTGQGSHEEQVAEAVLATDSDYVVRGVTLVLPLLDADAARWALIRGIFETEDAKHLKYRARNAGLALRSLDGHRAAGTLMRMVEGAERSEKAEGALIALGFLADDSTVEPLKEIALQERPGLEALARPAASALAHMRTEPALEACAELVTTCESSEVRREARIGIARAVGMEDYARPSPLAARPRWAGAISFEEACRVVYPRLQAAVAAGSKGCGPRELWSLVEHAGGRIALMDSLPGGG